MIDQAACLQNVIRRGALLGGAALMASVVGCAAAVAQPDEQNPESIGTVSSAVTVNDFTDGGGWITMRVKTCDYSGGFQSSATASCPVDPGFVLVGGGAKIDNQTGSRAMLTASYPNDSVNWIASSSEHVQSAPHRLRAYSVGMKLFNYSATTLESQIKRTWDASGWSNNPSAAVQMDTGFILLSGGAYVYSYQAPGQILTESRPMGDTWVASARDNQIGAPGLVYVYAIGVAQCPFQWQGGCIEANVPWISPGTPATGYQSASYSDPTAWVTAGIGGLANSDGVGHGRFLTDLVPVNGTSKGIFFGTKDHGGTDLGWSYGMPMEIRKRP